MNLAVSREFCLKNINYHEYFHKKIIMDINIRRL